MTQHNKNPQILKPLMKKTLLAAVMSAGLTAGALAQSVGIFGSYIGINANGAGNSWYGAQEWGTDIQNFGGANLGVIDTAASGTLTISGFQVQTTKSDGGDITGANLLYRVYLTNSTPPASFTSVAAGFISNSPFTAAQGSTAEGAGDQNWGLNPPGSYANVMGGITVNGVYNLEIYFDATSPQGTQFSNNGGANYIATFEVVPEPSTYALLTLSALAMGGYVIRRRRRIH
jgi:hypothetical protein